MNILLSKSRTILTLIALLVSGTIYSQTLYPPKMQSPNAASLGVFGETPVNLFTGTPNISIPLYTLSYGRIKVPIALNYNSAGVKPSVQPGWVGSGWNLDCGGAITRQKHGRVDEWLVQNDAGASPTLNSTMSYYPAPPGIGRSSQTPGSEYVNQDSWVVPAQLKADFNYFEFLSSDGNTMVQNQAVDPEADEFSFNVLGHSGRFYYEGSALGWKVVCDEDIKVELTDMFTPLEVVHGISEFVNNGPYNAHINPIPDPAGQSQMFGGFRLTLPDGTKLTFGGRHSFTAPPGSTGSGDAPDAVEMSSPRRAGGDPTVNDDGVFEINTWYLKTIIDPEGNQVNFTYLSHYPTTSKFYQVDNFGGVAQNGSGMQNYSGGNQFNKYVLTELMQWPVYLSSISSPNETINFNSSTASCSRYTQDKLNYTNFRDKTSSEQLEGRWIGSFPSGDPTQYLNNIQWQKLDGIVVTDNPATVGLGQAQPSVTRQFGFTYSNTSTQRLMLGSLQELDSRSGVIGQYQFGYNGNMVSTKSDLVADGNYSDHWGFYNGTDLISASSADSYDFSYARLPNPSVSTLELLNKITYPTGGATKFTWESNDYGWIVSSDRQSLVPYSLGVFGDNTLTGFGGGNRIFEITSVAADGTTLTDKKYYYKTGYTAGSNISSLSSSGVLNGQPLYGFGYSGVNGYKGVYTFSGTGTYMYSSGNYGYTGQGSPIGYKEVVEVNADGSYTRNQFTSYDADVNQVTHFDQAPAGILGWPASGNATINYFPMSTLELERGKLIATYAFKPDNTPLEKTIITYRSDAARFNSYLKVLEKRNEFASRELTYSNGVPAVPGDRIVLACARKIFNYVYYPISKTTTRFDEHGNNPIVVTENFTGYNSSNLLTNKNTVNSLGQTIYTTLKYPMDFPSTAPYPAMVQAHQFSPVIETTVLNGVAPVSDATIIYANPFSGVFAPQEVQMKVGSNAPEVREQVNFFDSKGHPLEIQKPGGVKEAYIWGVNNEHILAHIVGAGYYDASPLVSATVLNSAGFAYDPGSDAALRTELNKIRSGLPNALVTTYTYAIGLGITSETDPAGRTTSYNYDLFGRLAFTADHEGKIITRYCYNYNGQSTSCQFLHKYPVVASNSSTKIVHLSFAPADGGPTIKMDVQPGASNKTVGWVFEGTYTITMVPDNPTAVYPLIFTSGGSTQKYYATVSFGGIPVNTSYNINISTPPSYPVVVTNNTSQVANITFTDAWNNPFPALVSASGTSNVIVGYIPEGTYTVTVNPTAVSSSYPVVYIYNGNQQRATTQMTYSNQAIAASTSISVSPPAACPVIATNSANQSITLSFTDQSIPYTYSFSVPAGANNQNVGSIPQSTYDVTFHPNAATSTYPMVFSYEGSSQTNYSNVAFSNQQVWGVVSPTVKPVAQGSFYLSNTTTQTITVTATNSYGGNFGPWSQAPGVSGTLANVPDDTYTVTLSPSSPTSSYPILYSVPNNTQQWYGAVVFGGSIVYGQYVLGAAPAPAEPIIASNNTTKSVTLKFTEVNSGAVFTLTVAAGTGSHQVGTVPLGTYDVLMTPSSSVASQPILWELGNASQTYYGPVAFGGAVINGSTTITIIREY